MRHCRKYFKKPILCLLLISTIVIISASCTSHRSTVWGWGYNSYGQLGDGTDVYERVVPVQTDLSNIRVEIIDISAGALYTLAVTENGEVWAWGYNGSGQLGNSSITESYTPIQTDMTSMPAIVDVATGYDHSLAIDINGNVWAWGDNDYGELGDGTNYNTFIPVQTDMSSMPAIVDIAAGEYHTLALDVNGNVWAWGYNGSGQLGDGSTTTRYTPVQTVMTSMPSIVDIAAGEDHSLALDVNGNVWAWGYNFYGQLGNNSTSDSSVPVQTDMTSMSAIVTIAAGEDHSLALDVNGNVWAWGKNWDGQLGNASTSHRDTPVKVHNISDVTAISGGYIHSIAIQQANPCSGY